MLLCPLPHTILRRDLDREDTYLIELVLSKDGVIISLRVNGWKLSVLLRRSDKESENSNGVATDVLWVNRICFLE